MASFREMFFTPAEFANIAKIDRSAISALEAQGILKTVKRKMGNVDRKMISLEEMQNYFRILRQNFAVSSQVGHDSAVATATDPKGDIQGNIQKDDLGIITASGMASESPVAAATAACSAKSFSENVPTHKVQMFYNVKGGTGKSTLTAQYVMRAAMTGLNVLALDLDGQGHLTVNLDILDAHQHPTVYDVLINDLPIDQAVMNIAPGLDLIPGNLGLCNIEIPLNNKPRREYRLAEALAKIADNYDLIVSDTNPAASILNSSMLVAADMVNIVCATNPLSFHGMSLVMSTIEEMEREFRRQLEVKIIPNLYDNREIISQEVLGELRTQFSDCCTKAVVNRSADLNEATKRRTTVWDVNSKGVAANDINSLTEELLF
jgi:chromosome partitioning protein